VASVSVVRPAHCNLVSHHILCKTDVHVYTTSETSEVTIEEDTGARDVDFVVQHRTKMDHMGVSERFLTVGEILGSLRMEVGYRDVVGD
jgi:hypothetical protein